MSWGAVSVVWVTSAPVRTLRTLRSGAVAPRPGAAPEPSAPPTERAEPLLRLLVGAAFRRRREQQGRTLADVAADARVSIAYLSEIERGRKEPSSEVLLAVCHALGMRLADLLVEAADELRAAERRHARQAVTARTAGGRPARSGAAAPGPAGRAPRTAAPTVVDVRSVTERAERTEPDDDAPRALLSVA